MPAATRDRSEIIKLAAAGGVLGALALLNVYAVTARIDTSAVAVAAPAVGRAQPHSGAAGAGPRTEIAHLTDTTGRPLFHPDRKPAPRAAGPGSQPADAAAAMFELVGLMEDTDGLRRAMIRAGEEPAEWVRTGEQINGWQVTSIDSDAVTMEALGQRTALKLYGRQ